MKRGAAAAAVMVLAALTACDDAPTQVPPGIRDQLTSRIVAIAENDRAFKANVSTDADSIACAAEVFGTDPASPASADQVTVAYAHVVCSVVKPDLPTAAGMPVAVAFTDPPSIRFPTDGDQYPSSVRAIIPERLWDKAFAGPTNPDPLRTPTRSAS
jgi:hypothetical protein